MSLRGQSLLHSKFAYFQNMRRFNPKVKSNIEIAEFLFCILFFFHLTRTKRTNTIHVAQCSNLNKSFSCVTRARTSRIAFVAYLSRASTRALTLAVNIFTRYLHVNAKACERARECTNDICVLCCMWQHTHKTSRCRCTPFFRPLSRT